MHPCCTLGVLLVLGGAVACDPGAPDGKAQVLFFEPEYTGRIAENLTARIVIPQHVRLGASPKSLDRIENYDFAFEGSELQFSETSGLTIVDSTLDAKGWNIQFKCTATPGIPATLSVNVVDGTTTRYSDSTEVTCDRGSKFVLSDASVAQLGAPDSNFDHPHYIVGGTSNVVRVDLLNAEGMYLSGRGISGVNVAVHDGISGDAQLSGLTYLTGETPGPASLRLGDASYDLPFDIVSDDAWSFALADAVDFGSGPIWGINARFADGSTEPVGVLCEIATSDATGKPLDNSTGSCFARAQTGHGQVCIKIRSKTGCVNY